MKTDLDDFVLKHTPFVWRVLAHLGLRETRLEDGCQEVFLVALGGLSGFENRSSERTWLYGICRNVALQERRKHRERTEIPVATLPETVIQPAQEGELWIKRAYARLVQALELLDEEQRIVFVLYEIEQLTMQEIATEIHTPISTCYSRLHVAKERVYAELRRAQLPFCAKGNNRHD